MRKSLIVIDSNGYDHAYLNVRRGLETIPDIAKRYAIGVINNDSSFTEAVNNVCNVVQELGVQEYFVTPQRAGIALNNAISIMIKKIHETMINLPKEWFGAHRGFSFEESAALLGKAVLPSPEGIACGMSQNPGAIFNIKYIEGAGWFVEIAADYKSGIMFEADKEDLAKLFRVADVLQKDINEEDIITLFTKKLDQKDKEEDANER